MSINKTDLKNKNLKKNDLNKTQNILEQKKNVISNDIIDKNVALNKENLINKQENKQYLRNEDIEVLGALQDLDLSNEKIDTFENLPFKRLEREQRILDHMPAHLKGCKNRSARNKWKRIHKKRVKNAKDLLELHKKNLADYEKTRLQIKKDLEEDSIAIARSYIYNNAGEKKLHVSKNGKGDKVTVEEIGEAKDTADYLEYENKNLSGRSIGNLSVKAEEIFKEVDTLLKNYVIDEDQTAEKLKEQRDAEQKKRSKKGGKLADEEIVQDRNKIEQEIFARPDEVVIEDGQVKTDKNTELDKKMYNIQTRKEAFLLPELSALFKKVLKDAQNPFTRVKEIEKTEIVDGEEVKTKGHIEEDLSKERYKELEDEAKKLLEYAKKMGAAIPEELYYLIDIAEEENALYMGYKDKFKPEKNGTEAYALLLSASSKLFFNALNVFAGYAVTQDDKKLFFSDDRELRAQNYDVFNFELMKSVINIRDGASAVASRIRKNRLAIHNMTVPKDVVQEKINKENEQIARNAQPTGIDEEERKRKLEEDKLKEIHAEWEKLIKEDIRGIQEVDDKDMKKKKWILPEYADKILEIMKNNPECNGLTGEPLKRYLIGINDHLVHNLLQLNDELPKSSIGEEFCFVPKMRDDFIQKVKTEKFGMLLRSDFNFRDLLRNNSQLADLFDDPKYVAIKNRQREIMKVLNKELGIEYFTGSRQLASLWANEQILSLLTDEPLDKEAQFKEAEDKVKADLKTEADKADKGILKFKALKLINKSDKYGVSDENFKNSLEKIQATVHDNIAVINRKIGLMGICDTAKDVLMRTVLKKLGGEYLLGYSIISQDIVEYVCDNMMSYDGEAAEIQRTWDRKFARTKVPKRLSAKAERVVASKLNAKGKRDKYYLKPKGFKVGKEEENKWEETNKKANKCITALTKLYNNNIKNFLVTLVNAEDTKTAIPDNAKLFVNGKIKLTKRQWDLLEDYFENEWLDAFEKVYSDGKYNKGDVEKKMPDIKAKMLKAIENQLIINQDKLKKAEKNGEDVTNFKDSLITREEFSDGLKNNKVIETRKTVVEDDIQKQIFEDQTLAGIFRKKEEREMFMEVLKDILGNKNSPLHAKFDYLDGIENITQLGELSLISYSQFFADLKSLLLVVNEEENKETGKKEKTNRLLLDKWRLSSMGGSDIYGIKKKLLKDLLNGEVTNDNYAAKLKTYQDEAKQREGYNKMRIDAYLATDMDLNDTYLKFNYLEVVGKSVNQVKRIRKINLARDFWKNIQKSDENLDKNGKHYQREDKLLELFNRFLDSLEDLKPSDKRKKIQEFGLFFQNLKITTTGNGNDLKYSISSAKELEKAKKYFNVTSINQSDLEAFFNAQLLFKNVSMKEGVAEKDRLNLGDCIGEIFMFGCGQQYFGAGGKGEKTFLNSNDDQYYADIAKTGRDIITKWQNVKKTLDMCKLEHSQMVTVMSRLKPVIAGVELSLEKDAMADNLKRYGVEGLNELNAKLMEIYFPGENTEANLKKSKEFGQIYIKRRDFIDNYGETDKIKGKFRVIRDYLFKDQEVWEKIITLSDEEFINYVEELNRKYSPLLDVLKNDDYRGSGPINEQYIMSNWENFKSRENWTQEQWKKDVANFYNGFMQETKGKKTGVQKTLDSVTKKMVKAKMDPNEKGSTLLMKLSYILSADPESFNLLYDDKLMFEAIKKLDNQYKKNMEYVKDTFVTIQKKIQTNEEYVSNKEDDALYKECARIYNTGDMVSQQKEMEDSAAVLRKLAAKREPSENDKMYAEYSLFMQIIMPYAFSAKEDVFRQTFLDKLKEFQSWQTHERNTNIYSDRNVLDTKDDIRLSIEIRKNEGKSLERVYNKDYEEYREKKALLGSVGLVAYNANPRFDAKDIKKLRKYIDENLEDTYKDTDQEFIKGLLVEKALSLTKVKEEDLKGHLVAEMERLVTLYTALQKEAKGLSENDIKKAVVFAFAQNATRIKLPLDGSHEGDIKEILDELSERDKLIKIDRPASKLAQNEYDEFMAEMDIARFTMSKAQFAEICDKKKKYFKLVDVCVEKVESVSDDLKVQLGLFTYLKKDIFETLNSEKSSDELLLAITGEIDKILGDKVEGRNKLSAENIKKINLSYISDSGSLMQGFSSGDVTAEEKLYSSTKFTRADVEKEISLSGNKDIINQYNSLTVDEQKVFAIALTFPDIGLTDSENLTSNVALRDEKKDYEQELVLQEELANYIYDQDFAPKIDYNVVMRRLLKTDRKTGLKRVSKTMFDKAMKYTQFCIQKKFEMIPKDYDKLSDGLMTGDLGRILAGKSADCVTVKQITESGEYKGADAFRTTFTKFADSEIKEDGSVEKIVKRFAKYSNVQINMLIHILQDRTCIDYTTSDSKKNALLLGGVSFVNEERRQQIKTSFTRSNGMDEEFIAKLNRSVDNEMFEKAAETLFSYQLRDDVDFRNKDLTSKDFAKNALERKTRIDWKMLERAMDFVDEIANENLKIQVCRQTVEHTTDPSSPNVKARALGKEIDERFKEKDLNYEDYFNDVIAREAKKDPEVAMPLISAYSGLSTNEKMLFVHALKHRDILDISTDNTFTTAIGMNENQYVNEKGRNELADYYVDHLSVPGAKNILATTQYDLRDAMKSLISTQISDARSVENKKSYADLMEGKKIFNWVYVGGRKTGIDWNLFGNALKFVKRTEQERKLYMGNAEAYRSAGQINKYGRFMYNYNYLRKNLYRSGYRLTRFMGRRVRAEIEAAIPGYGVGQRIMMMCLSPKYRNKMLSSGFVKPGESKNATTEYLGYAGMGGTAASALSMVNAASMVGMKVFGEGLTQISNALSGLYNVGTDISRIKNADKPLENEEELKKQGDEKAEAAEKYQTKAQQDIVKDNKLNNEFILNEVAGATVTAANKADIMETMTTCINVLSGSSFGISCVVSYFAKGIQAAIQETLHTARFIMSVCSDKKMMDKYFSEAGPFGKEIADLKGENIKKIIDDQQFRDIHGSSEFMQEAALKESDADGLKAMSNSEIFRKAYGFKDFSEQASYVGWNIVQTLLFCASPFSTRPEQFMRASLLLSAIGCKDVIGKQDDASAQKVYDKLMGKDIR